MLRPGFLTIAAILTIWGFSAPRASAEPALLNASYDVSRELFTAINQSFSEYWKKTTGQGIEIDQSHGGSSKQAQAILQGLKADVVTFNQVTDVQVLHDRGNLVAVDWQQRLPNSSSPYYSTTAFLVRKGNPKNIRDWDDLVRDDVKLVFPNPKTSGNGRYTYLAAWLHAHRKFNGDETRIREFIRQFLRNVAVFDTGGRAATVSFAENGIGDVLLSFESEIRSISKEYDAGAYEVVVPKVSILAEFPVAVVDKVVDQRGTRKVAEAYLEYLYSPAAQEILATHAYRVHDPAVKNRYADRFPAVELLKVEDVLGSWEEIQKVHFDNKGVLDQLLAR